MSIRLVLLTTAEVDALQELVATAQSQAAFRGRPEFFDTMLAVCRLSESARVKRANEALGQSVRWNKAGRVYFGLTPVAAREIRAALEHTRPFWDAGRGAKLVRWFLGRLK